MKSILQIAIEINIKNSIHIKFKEPRQFSLYQCKQNRQKIPHQIDKKESNLNVFLFTYKMVKSNYSNVSNPVI
jgi:hypothetical protein